MNISDFKQVEVKKTTGLKALFNGAQLKRTLRAMLIGAALAFGWFYLTEGRHMDVMIGEDIFKSLMIGAFFGFFITNSPCARGRC